MTYSWKGTIVPDVSFEGENIVDESHGSFFRVLFDRIEQFVSRDLFYFINPALRGIDYGTMLYIPHTSHSTIAEFQQSCSISTVHD